jgi:thiol-disulfide isomerase/thioredoxin
MTLQELGSTAAVQDFIGQNKNTLVTFSAHWCGPCRASKPALTDMAAQYTRDVTKDVKFGIVYENDLGEDIHQFRIRAFPTYVLFVGGTEAQRVEGVNLDAIRQMINQAGCTADLSGGETLGGGTAKPLSHEEARALRLEKLGPAATSAPAPPPSQIPITTAPPQETEVVAMEEDKPVEAANMEEEDVAMKEAEVGEKAVAVDPCASLDKEALATLTESMGFPLLRAQKGLLYGNGGSVEGAVDWLTEHQDDEDIDLPIPTTASGVVAQSYRCNECGKILSNMANLELHANKTGHSDFEESTERVKPLTEEEKVKKIAEIKDLLKAKRAERENAEKEEEKERERQRRFMGKEMAKTREQVEMETRKREVYLRKKEKEDARRERERIRAELAKDKAERQANKGRLSSKLGVEGYHPDAIQYDVGPEPDDQHHHKKLHASTVKIDDYIKMVSGYRAAGDGGNCLKVLIAYVGNVVKNPDEQKFKSINMENKAFKFKVKPLKGAKALLEAVGFEPNESGDALVLREDADVKLLSDTAAKLEAALAAYLK